MLTNDPSLQLHARLKRKFRKVATHRHTHAAETKQAWVDVRMGCGEGTGEGLGIGAGVGMGVGNDKVGRGVGNGVGCEGGLDMGLSMTGRLPNPIFEGDFHPMPSGWAETKLSSRHGDEEHAVVPQHRSVTSQCRRPKSPRGTGIRKYWSHYIRVGLCRSTKAAIPRLPGAKAPGD